MLTESAVAAARFRVMTDPARNAVETDETDWRIPGVDTSRRFDPSLSDAERGRLESIASVEREPARFAAEDEAAARLPPRPVRRRTGASVVLSVRVDPAQLAALERQAAVIGIKPTVLARNLVRAGLSCPGSSALVHAVDQPDAAVAELHSLVH
jgi:hypothetical protein